MKLIDLVKRLPWPDGAAVCTQDADREVAWSSVADVRFMPAIRAWINGPLGDWVEVDFCDLAEDHMTAIITHADWLEVQEQVGSIEATHSEAAMNTETQIPMPEVVSIPKQDLDALLAELEALRKLQQEKQKWIR